MINIEIDVSSKSVALHSCEIIDRFFYNIDQSKLDCPTDLFLQINKIFYFDSLDHSVESLY